MKLGWTELPVVIEARLKMEGATCWGILGASKIANDFSVALKTLPAEDHRLVAIAARSLERAQEFAAKHGVEKAYGSYEELMLDPNVQVVYVSTINTSHKELSLLALKHGKHVLCEKPLTLNLKEAKEVIDLAKEKGLFLMEALWTRFFPLYARAKELRRSQAIGDLKLIIASFGCMNIKSLERIINPECGGGGLLDLGIYCLNIVDIFFDGETPLKITANGYKTDSGVDDTLCIHFMYSNNRMAQVFTSIDAHLPNDCDVIGTKGSFKICTPFWSSTKIIKHDGTEEAFPLPEPSLELNFINSTGLRFEIQEVREKLLSGKTESDIMPHSNTLRILGWMDEIRRQIGVVFKED